MSRPESSMETIAQELGDRLDVLDPTRARRMIEARLFPGATTPPRVGRFELHEMLGAGGMGVVYAAHDPELGRDVAIKMLRPSGDSGSPDQLVREARALARVSDPNVVTIFEAGTDEGQLFFVMELVRGQTLGAWCAAQRELGVLRKWSSAVMRAFREAGKGLAAVHAAQLVHLDFKPSNVLVGDDGRVRVTDFGIVRIADAQLDTAASGERGAFSGSSGTRIHGTPAYMSPEQLVGTRVDLRSDVFSYCVALYEALFDASPYPAQNLAEKLGAFGRGDAKVPGRRGVPGRVAAAIERGLRIDAAARWPSMAPLLAALEPPTRPKVLVASALGLAIGGAAVFSMSANRPEPEPCRQAADLVATAWSPARATSVRLGFGRTGLPYAERAASTAAARLQDYAEAWVAAHTEACVATRVHGHQSDAVLAQRIECLDARLVELDAVAGAFENAAAPTVENANEAIGMLGSIDACADLEALARAEALPTDPDLRARAETLRRSITEARAQAPADGSVRALERAHANVAEARALGYEPLLLTALVDAAGHELSALEFDACNVTIHEALGLLTRVRDDALEAWAWRILVRTYDQRGDPRRAVELLPALDIASGRTGDPELVARGHLAAADVLRETSDLEAAQARLDAGEEALQSVAAPLEFARLLVASAALARRRGDLPRARELDVQAVLLMLALEGPDHPSTAQAMTNLAIEETVLGHPDRALALLERVHAIRAPLIADDGLEMAQLHANLGTVLWRAGRIEEAREQLILARLICEERLGPDSIFTATTLLSLSSVEVALGDLVEAESDALASLDIVATTVGRADPRAAAALETLGEIEQARERWTASEHRFTEALQIRERAGSDELDTSLLGLARAELGQGRVAAAQERLGRVVERSIASGEPWRGNRLEAELVLARIELETGERAAGLARLETVRARARDLGRAKYEREAADALAAAGGNPGPPSMDGSAPR